MSHLIDRRLNSPNKSVVNRQRFMRRYREQIRKAVDESMGKRSITDMEHGEQITIPSRDLLEPVLGHGPGGERSIVHPGNKEFVAGDRIKRNGGDGQGAGGKASKDGTGDDEFSFQINSSEFLEYVFDGLCLPNLVKRRLKGDAQHRYVRAGYSTEGSPAKLDIERTLMSAKARRIGLSGSSRRRLREKKQTLLAAQLEHDLATVSRLRGEIGALRRRVDRVPYLDDLDMRYRLHAKQPVPISQAVMFCVMDVSGSMDQQTKDLAKRFFLLLYLFLQRNYQRTEVVFIRHHTTAAEVDEETFFYARETGGTVVSSALTLMNDIIDARYPLNEWNIYGAQASDGDNWPEDSPRCSALMTDAILPKVQYYTYVEITRRDHQALWQQYEQLLGLFPDRLAIRQLVEAADIFPVFRDLFSQAQAA